MIITIIINCNEGNRRCWHSACNEDNTLSEDTSRDTFLSKQNFSKTLRVLSIPSTLVNLFFTKNLEVYLEIETRSVFKQKLVETCLTVLKDTLETM